MEDREGNKLGVVSEDNAGQVHASLVNRNVGLHPLFQLPLYCFK